MTQTFYFYVFIVRKYDANTLFLCLYCTESCRNVSKKINCGGLVAHGMDIAPKFVGLFLPDFLKMSSEHIR